MQVTERGTARYHHPHGILWICGLAWLPLMFGYKKSLHLLYVERAQDAV
jgi:hypothetical protein